MNIPGKDDAERLTWLGRHRFWPVADFLLERGAISTGLAGLARQLAQSQRQAMQRQLEEDRRVVSALAEAGVPVLVLKGALLAQTVYPAAESRFRTDLDLLAEPARISAVEQVLEDLEYVRPMAVQSAMPMRQTLWTRRGGTQAFSVDLHWDLRNHPALQARFDFEELMAYSQPMTGLHEQAAGMGRSHALLNASMHYFNDYADDRPCQALLDKDLLWRAMNPNEQSDCIELACERGLAGLLAESLALAREQFDTPVAAGQLTALRNVGKTQRATGLVLANEKRRSAYWFALMSEPGLRRKLIRLKSGLFPSASYIRQLYPEGSRFGLVALYLRRIWRS